MHKQKMKNETLRIANVFLFFQLAASISACSMDTDTDMARKRVELAPGVKNERYSTDLLQENELIALADDYAHAGDGTVQIDVTYDPASKNNTAMEAALDAARIAEALGKRGVPVQSELVPVSGQGDESKTLVSYRTVSARAPEGCESLGGLDGKQTEINRDYGYGCTIEMQLARQIARPADLAGREGLDSADGRRQSIIVERYKGATPNEALEGETVAGAAN